MADPTTSTTALPPFSGSHPTCAKCGHHDATVKHTFGQPMTLCRAVTPTGMPERLCRECVRCGYHWDEALAVAQPAVWSAYEANLLLEDTERMLAGQGFAVRLGPHDRLTAVKFETIKEQQ
jgi:Zn ribbon nucleic-acid-binding protein